MGYNGAEPLNDEPMRVKFRELLPRLLLLAVSSLAAIGFADRLLLPRLEDLYLFQGPAWRLANKRINQSNDSKITMTWTFPVWSSRFMPFPPPKRKRHAILVLGDSFVWGDGYANINDAWWRQLARELEDRGYQDVDVFAAGHCGDSTQQELFSAEAILPILKPDIVVWGYVTNDPDNGLVPQMLKVPTGLADKFLDHSGFGWLFPNADQLLRSQFAYWRARRLAGPKMGYPYDEWEDKLLEGPSLRAYESTLSQVKSYMTQAKTPFFFLGLPTSDNRSRFSELFGAVKPLFKDAGITFVDSSDEFFKRYHGLHAGAFGGRYLRVNGANGHPGPFSTHFYADYAANILEKRFATALGRKSRSATQAPLEINDATPPVYLSKIGNGTYQFQYPWEQEYLLMMPLRKPHIQLNLAQPAAIEKFELKGPAIESAELLVTRIDPKLGFDDRTILSLGAQRGTSLEWSGPGPQVQINTLLLAIRFSDALRQEAELRLIPAKR